MQQKYVCCDNQPAANGKRLRRLGNVHLFKGGTAAGPFTRAFFTSGLTFDKLVITFDDSFRLPADLAAEGVRYSIGIRWLATDAKRLAAERFRTRAAVAAADEYVVIAMSEGDCCSDKIE